MAYHRNKKKKNSDRFMSGVLYTPEKVPVSKQDFSPKRQSPGKEKILKKLCEENLHIEEIGVTDNFFALGGDSLKAIKLATAAKKEGILFDLAQLYDQGTIRGLAQAAAFTCEMDEEKEEEREAVKEEELEAILAAIES